MLHKRPLTLAVRATLGVGSMVMAFPLLAQEELGEVVITGSRIQKSNLVASSPVAQIDAVQLAFTGSTRVEDAVAQLPQIGLDQDSGQSIESNGTATLGLRGLGVSRTLVLFDGRRLPIASPSSSESAADINFIPMALLERVEVLTGGASSVYGSDAVAGVVNFIPIKDFEGVQFSYQASGYRHDNDGNRVADASIARGFAVPTGTSSDGDMNDVSFVVGGNLNDGRGNVTAYATYRDISAITQSERDYSACAIGASGNCGGSATSAQGSFYFESDGFSNIYYVDGDQFVPGFVPFNFAPPSYYQRPDERVTLGALAHYQLSDFAEVYTQLMFMDNRTVAQFAPAGMFFDSGISIPCSNPNLSAQQYATMGCTSPTDVIGAYIGRRNVEGGPRFGDLRHTTYRGVVGLRGDINEAWRYDVSGQYSEVDMRNRNGNYADVALMQNALNVDANGECQVFNDGSDTNCVPWNIFQTGGVTQAAVDYFAQQFFERGTTDQRLATGYVQGSLGEYGVKLPWAESGIDVVFGAEWREETLQYIPDDAAQRGDIGGLAAPLVPIDGGYEVTELFTEFSVPIIEGKTGAKALTLDLGYRYSDYDTDIETDTWKTALSWAINDSLMLRGSFQRAVRAPNIVDLFQPQSGGLFDMDDDPCADVDPVTGLSGRGYTFEQCARSGVSQAVWDAGGPASSPAQQYNALFGGNTQLDPEESDAVSFGLVFTPTFVNGLIVSIDYYDIDVQDAITEINPETTLTTLCIEQNINCNLVHRGPADTLWLGTSTATNGVNALSQNIGFFRTKGYDVEVIYSFDIGRGGSLTFQDRLGLVDSWEQEEYPGAGIERCDGFYGGSCALPTIETRNNFSTTWATPWDVTLNLTWRYLSGVDQIGTSTPTNIPAQDYFDLAASWDIAEFVSLHFGVSNLLDEEPPIITNGVTARVNGNTYSGVYDHLGMYWFLGASMRF
jgi:outer membrane receptor protein involved in Fe transport